MRSGDGAVLLRAMSASDVEGVLDVQEPASVRALAGVFPQETHPFPREEIGRRWCEEIADPGIACYVVETGHEVVGFAATRSDELLHFGIALEHWGSGAAAAAHGELLELMRREGVTLAWLTVFTGNGRGRRFYEKHGWVATGERSRTAYPPHPELLRYERRLD